ncbi:MBL fold metallo-hydrolase [Patescibacteria group bacterium]|nr:MBL fold metallo-hydrolase [Patescibacteria group bacterium]
MKRSDVILVVLVYLLFSFRGVASAGDGYLNLEILDVGQGDSILITTPNGKRVLVDGGDNYESDYEISKRIPFYSCYIDILILTHPHYDHIVGLNRIMQRCKIGTIMFNDVSFDSRDFRLFKELSSNFNIKNMYAGDIFEIDEVNFIFLWPDKKFLQNRIPDLNDMSFVFLVDYGKFEALLTGDATEKVLGRLSFNKINELTDSSLDVLKVPHHGSKYSLHKYFYSGIDPKMCVISVGKDNKFSHPYPGLVEYLNEIGCNVLRTDESGDVLIRVR